MGSIVPNASSQTPDNSIVRNVNWVIVPLRLQRMPKSLRRCVKIVLQAASLIPLPQRHLSRFVLRVLHYLSPPTDVVSRSVEPSSRRLVHRVWAREGSRRVPHPSRASRSSNRVPAGRLSGLLQQRCVRCRSTSVAFLNLRNRQSSPSTDPEQLVHQSRLMTRVTYG